MKIINTISEMQAVSAAFRTSGKTIGFVPTMGFLHEGHLSLMRKAREENDIVVASIFVNPTQFGRHEDLDRYPRDAEGDRKKCHEAGVDIVFMPGTGEMYPGEPSVFVTVEGLSDVLEGAIRPGHFRGVATVVAKLFNIVSPHAAYFGQKDYQQCLVIKRMVKGLDMAVAVKILPTIREPDGLAMSSRNSYLSSEERRAAPVLYRAMQSAAELFKAGTSETESLKQRIGSILRSEPGITAIDYIEIADRESLAPITIINTSAVILIAIRVGRTRLIDNILIE